MKIAEALILRADYARRFTELKSRCLRNALVQEGEAVAEDPGALLEEAEGVAQQLTQLIARINRTNIVTMVDETTSLTDALARRDVLRLRQALYRELATAATVTMSRVSRSEVKYKSTVRVSDIQAKADALAKEYRALDAKIQEANWRYDLIE